MSSFLLQQVGAILTAFLGFLAIISPSVVERLVSVQAIGKLGTSEIRATYGGFFLGLALFALFTQTQNVYLALGFGWVGAAIVRMVTIVFGSYTAKNLGGVIFELIIGFLCLSSIIT